MHLLDGLMYVFCPHITMHLQKLLLKLLDLEHIILNIKFNQFERTMLLNFPQRLSTIIVWLWEFKFNTLSHMSIHNGLAESLIKRIKLIARPLLQNCNLPTSCWGHEVVHAADLIQLRPTTYHVVSPLQLVCGNMPNISHLRKFGCAVYVPISLPKRTSMGPHRKLGIYVGYQSPSIIKYLEPLTGDLFMARYTDYIFNE